MIEDLCWQVEELFCIGYFAMLCLHFVPVEAVGSATEIIDFI